MTLATAGKLPHKPAAANVGSQRPLPTDQGEACQQVGIQVVCLCMVNTHSQLSIKNDMLIYMDLLTIV